MFCVVFSPHFVVHTFFWQDWNTFAEGFSSKALCFFQKFKNLPLTHFVGDHEFCEVRFFHCIFRCIICPFPDFAFNFGASYSISCLWRECKHEMNIRSFEIGSFRFLILVKHSVARCAEISLDCRIVLCVVYNGLPDKIVWSWPTILAMHVVGI